MAVTIGDIIVRTEVKLAIGGEAIGIDVLKTITGAATKSDTIRLLKEGQLATAPTLMWPLEGTSPTTFKHMALLADPGNQGIADLPIDFQITINGSTFVQRVDRRAAIVFSSEVAANSATFPPTNTITKIEARNPNTVAVSVPPSAENRPPVPNNVVARVIVIA